MVARHSRWVWLSFAMWLIACKGQPSQPAHRVEVRKLGGESIEIVPLAGTPEHCLVFSISASGVVRQLTMNADNTSFTCEPGRPIGDQPFRILAREGKVRLYALFSDQKLEAGPLAEQIQELKDKPDLSGLDLRAPGRLVTDMVEFTPEGAR